MARASLLASRWDVAADLREGRLVHGLAAHSEPADIWAASTARLSLSAKVRACVGFLQEQLTRRAFALEPDPQ